MAELQSPTERREQRRRAALDSTADGEPSRNSRLHRASDEHTPGSPRDSLTPERLPTRTSRLRTSLNSPTASQHGDLASPASVSRTRRSQAVRRRGTGTLSHDSGSERSVRRGGHKDQGHHSHEPLPPQGTANMHIIGEIAGASGFEQPALYCRWQLMYEPTKTWAVLRGMDKGATQVCSPSQQEDGFVVWDHPLDLQLMMQTVQGWPSLVMMVYARNDSAGKDEFVSYGIVPLPKNPGIHHLTCQTWYAVETNHVQSRRLFAWLTGLTPRMEDEGFVLDTEKRADAGPFVCTIGAGCVHLRLQILIKDAHNLHYLSGQSLFAALEKVRLTLEKKNRRDLVKIAHMKDEEEEDNKHKEARDSEGLRQVRQGREARMDAAQRAIDSRRSRETSLAGSFSETRSQSAEPRRSQGGMHRTDSLSAPRERRMSGQGRMDLRSSAQDSPRGDRSSAQGPLGERPSMQSVGERPSASSGGGGGAGGSGRAGSAVAESAGAPPPPPQATAAALSRAQAGSRALSDKLEAAVTLGTSASEDEGNWLPSEEELRRRQAARQARRAAAAARR